MHGFKPFSEGNFGLFHVWSSDINSYSGKTEFIHWRINYTKNNNNCVSITLWSFSCTEWAATTKHGNHSTGSVSWHGTESSAAWSGRRRWCVCVSCLSHSYLPAHITRVLRENHFNWTFCFPFSLLQTTDAIVTITIRSRTFNSAKWVAASM